MIFTIVIHTNRLKITIKVIQALNAIVSEMNIVSFKCQKKCHCMESAV